mmetsp:Transcript_67221/g.186225  ORF Transcript_67221/g.186225 Transcript_67221/m.186225 type:complete len:298 (+) Transcript_67221:46-939(+)
MMINGRTSQSGEAAASMSEECCVICFEHRPFVSMPCPCQVNYCASCWDRALAASITARGRGQCPTCRSDFRVDFNPKTGGLVFALDASGRASHDWRSRLYGKAKPVQIKMLRDYGASMAGGAKGSSGNALAAAGAGVCGEAKVAECRKGRLPSCVCGGELERMSSRVRILLLVEASDPGWRSTVSFSAQETAIARLMASKLVPCNLCQDDATRTGYVWTCKNGAETMLHPAGFDVCETCFALHVGPEVAKICARNQRRCHSHGYSAGRASLARRHDILPAISHRVLRFMESALDSLP